MEKRITLVQTVATAGVFSAISFWYGFMFGRESSRKELSHLIEDLRRGIEKQIGLGFSNLWCRCYSNFQLLQISIWILSFKGVSI
ncbi:uncharacterized protein LOC131628438 [Vicia villosa]|uniref:uncharacterized protein LOC131628438 n=1 Tax=Vicia villosa TaxID=3911 RepID=UPI00273BA928|nr:uncharacterized protein LOC131628438 [Vicia villosa]